MKYLLIRFFLILPTVILVSIIAFFMSRAVPGDQVDAIMLLRGVNPEYAQGDNPEYSRVYVNENLHLPLFYFSILPDFYPKNLRAITDKYRRNTIKVLLQKKYQYSDIENYLDARNEFVTNVMQLLRNSTEVETKENSPKQNLNIPKGLNILSGILFKDYPEDVLESVNQLEVLFDSAITDNALSLSEAIVQMDANRRTFYYLVFHWNGTASQYHQWVTGFIRMDMGISMKDGQPVWKKISAALKWTLTLLFLNLVFTMIIGVPVGILSGRFPDSVFDRWAGYISLGFYSMPVFWFASMMIIFFTTSDYGLKIFSIPGNFINDGTTGFIGTLVKYSGQLVLPVLCLVLNDIAYLSRLVRSGYLKEKTNLYALFASTKGLDENSVAYKHILPNSLIPLITIIAGSIPSALAGTLVIEVIFNIPGMGRLMHSSIFSADWNVVFAILVVLSVLTILILYVADLLYVRFNPKIQLGNNEG